MTEHARPHLSIVIVNYNGGQLVLDCLRSILRHPPETDFEIVVVDNASIDESAKRIAEEFAQVRLFRLEHNRGLTGGFNHGVAQSAGTYILSLDNDTVILPGALQRMVAFLDANPTIGACGCELIYPDGTPQQTARRFPHPLNALFGRRSLLTKLFPGNPISQRYLMTDAGPRDVPFDVDTLSTACMMVRRAVVDDVGAYDEAFFVYWSDTDWCHRIKTAGWPIYSLPDSRVIHNENIKARHRKGRRVRSVLDFHRGAYRYFRKHHIRSPFNPMNLVALVGLSSRAAILLLSDEVRFLIQRLRPPPQAR